MRCSAVVGSGISLASGASSIFSQHDAGLQRDVPAVLVLVDVLDQDLRRVRDGRIEALGEHLVVRVDLRQYRIAAVDHDVRWAGDGDRRGVEPVRRGCVPVKRKRSDEPEFTVIATSSSRPQ